MLCHGVLSYSCWGSHSVPTAPRRTDVPSRRIRDNVVVSKVIARLVFKCAIISVKPKRHRDRGGFNRFLQLNVSVYYIPILYFVNVFFIDYLT